MKTFELFKGRWHYWTVYYPGSLIRLSSKRGEKNPEDREFPLGKFSFYISFAMVTVFMQTYFKQWWHPKKKNSKKDLPYRCGPEIQPIHSQTQYLSGRYVSWYPHKPEGFNQMRLVCMDLHLEVSFDTMTLLGDHNHYWITKSLCDSAKHWCQICKSACNNFTRVHKNVCFAKAL